MIDICLSSTTFLKFNFYFIVYVIPGTKKDLSGIKLCADGERWDETRGPESEAVKSRQDLIDERRRKAVQYRKVAEAQRQHFLYAQTCKLADGGDS